MKSKSPLSSHAPVLPWLAAMFVFAGTVHAGSIAQIPGSSFRSAGVEAVGGAIGSVPVQLEPAISSFLNSPNNSVTELNKAILTLS